MEPEMLFPLYVFDAYGTLFDVHSAVARHRDLAGPQADRLSDIWRTKQLEYTWTRSLMGAYRDFDLLTRDALDFAAARCGGLTPEARKTLLSAYETLDAYADAAMTLKALRARGARTVILSNGTPTGLARAVRSAGLESLSGRVALGRRSADLQDRAGRLWIGLRELWSAARADFFPVVESLGCGGRRQIWLSRGLDQQNRRAG